MLDTLITSKTRIKILLRFFLNGSASSYLRNLESELEESTNSIRRELNKFESAGLLIASASGNKKLFKANVKHPMFNDIQNILHKYTGIDKIITQVISKLGNLENVYLIGDLAKGIDSPKISLILVGEVNVDYMHKLSKKAEGLIHKKIEYTIFTHDTFTKQKTHLLDQPHIEILN